MWVRYVGKSINPKRRFEQHKYVSFKIGHHTYNTPKSRWFRKKMNQIYFSIIEECSNETWEEREAFWIEHYSANSLLNCTNGGEGTHGYKMTDQQRENIRKSQLGRKHTAESRLNMSLSKKGKMFFSEEHRKKLSDAAKGRVLSAEHRAKVSQSNKGRKVWNKGISAPSPMAGKKHTPETIEKMKVQRQKISEETRRRMSESAKTRNQWPSSE